MSLDLSAVEKALRPLTPQGASAGGLRTVDTYVKAFYLPWEELPGWAQRHLPEFGGARIAALVDCVAEAYGVKRAQRNALIDQIDSHMREFA